MDRWTNIFLCNLKADEYQDHIIEKERKPISAVSPRNVLYANHESNKISELGQLLGDYIPGVNILEGRDDRQLIIKFKHLIINKNWAVLIA